MLGKPPLVAGASTTICAIFISRAAPLCTNLDGNLCPTLTAHSEPLPFPELAETGSRQIIHISIRVLGWGWGLRLWFFSIKKTLILEILEHFKKIVIFWRKLPLRLAIYSKRKWRSRVKFFRIPHSPLLGFIKPILGNRYGPGVIPQGRGQRCRLWMVGPVHMRFSPIYNFSVGISAKPSKNSSNDSCMMFFSGLWWLPRRGIWHCVRLKRRV